MLLKSIPPFILYPGIFWVGLREYTAPFQITPWVDFGRPPRIYPSTQLIQITDNLCDKYLSFLKLVTEKLDYVAFTSCAHHLTPVLSLVKIQKWMTIVCRSCEIFQLYKYCNKLDNIDKCLLYLRVL